MNQIDIKIRTLVEGVQGIQNYLTQLQALQQQAFSTGAGLNTASGGFGQVGQAAASASPSTRVAAEHMAAIQQHAITLQGGLGDLQATLRATGAGFSALGSYVKSAVVAFAAFAAIKGTKELADYAARTETLGVTLNIVGSNAGYTKGELDKFESSLKKLGITSQSAREGMTAMIQAGIPLAAQTGQTTSNVERLARAAQDLAVVTGENSSATFRRMITNIQQMDTMGLRFMGITVDIKASQDTFAQSLGVSADALTQQQKVMAVNNAVLLEAAKLQGSYEASMETVGKKVSSLTRYQEELSESLGKKLLPAYGAVVDAATNMLDSLKKISDQTDNTGEASRHFGESVAAMANVMTDAGVSFGQFLSDNAGLIESMASNLIGLVTDLISVSVAFGRAAEESGLMGSALYVAAVAVAGLRDGMRMLEVVFLDLATIALGTFGKIAQGWGMLTGAFGKNALSDSLLAMGDALEGLATKAYKEAGAITKGFSENRSATMNFINGVEEANVSLSNFGKAGTLSALKKEFDDLATVGSTYGASSKEMHTAQDQTVARFKSMVAGGKLSEEAIADLIKQAQILGIELPKGFTSGVAAINAMTAASQQAREELSKIGTGKGGIDGLISDIKLLKKAQTEGTITGYEQRIAVDKLAASLAALKDSGATTSLKKLEEAGRGISGVYSALGSSFTDTTTAMGVSAEELRTGVSKKFEELSGNLIRFSKEGQATADQFREYFTLNIDSAKTVGEVNSLMKSIEEARKRGAAEISAGNNDTGAQWIKEAGQAAALAAAQFDKVFATSAKAAKTQEDFVRLQQNVVEFGSKSGQSIDWINSKLDFIGVAAKRAGEDIKDSAITAALQKIGMTAEEMRGQASRAAQDAGEGLNALAKDATVTGDQFFKAFSKGVDSSKTMGDISAFRTSLNTALSEGKIGWSEYAGGIQAADQKFMALFQTQLKSADSKEKLSQLKDEALKLGNEGAISATQLANAMQLIAQKASGGTAEVARLAEQASALASKSVDVANANKGVLEASLGVQRAQNEVTKAGNADRQKSTDLSRAELQATQASLATAQAKQEVAQASADLKQGEYSLAQADAELANAKARAERDGSAASERAVQAAQNHRNEVQATVAGLKQAVSAAQELEAAQEAAAAAAKQNADNVASSAASSGGGTRAGGSFVIGSKAAMDLQLEGQEYSKFLADAGSKYMKLWNTVLKRVYSMDDLVQKLKYIDKEADAYAKEQLQLERNKKLEAERTAELEKQAGVVTDKYNRAIEADRAARLGLQPLKAGADALSKAFYDMKVSAAEASKAAVEAVRGFSSSALGIRQELLKAQGKEEEATRLSFKARQQDLLLQYQQLQVQIQISRVQAKAAGISTSDIERAAAEASAAFSQAKSDLVELENIELRKQAEAQSAASKNAKNTTDASARAANNAETQATAESKVNDALAARSDILAGELSLRERINRSTSELQRNLTSAMVQSASGPTPTLPKAITAGIRPVDMSKVVLEIGGRSSDIFVQPDQRDNLLDVLSQLKSRSS